MRRDQKINLYYWLAAAAFAVVLMPAAPYIEHLTVGGQIATVVVALIIALLCLGKAVSLAWKDEESALPGERRQKMIPLIGMIVFGVGFIGCAAWFFWPTEPRPQGALQSISGVGSLTPAPLAPLAQGPFDDFLELTCLDQQTFTLPPDGNFYNLEMVGTDHDGSAGFTRRWVSEFAARSPHILPGANSNLEVCKITNYSDVPIFNLRTIVKVDFMNTQNGDGGIGGTGVQFSRNGEINIPKIEAKGKIEFFVCANSPLVVWVTLPEIAEIQRLGSAKRETVRFIRTQPAYFVLSPKFWLKK